MSTVAPRSGSARVDVVIVGAGILGLATARALATTQPDLRITVLERESSIGAHQTGHNSGVIHAGIYYEPGSLKARLCTDGARRMYAFCEEHAVPVDRCGKLIVASHGGELERLGALEARGRANGVPGLRRLAAAEIGEIEPDCVGVGALHSPATGIVDYGVVAERMAADLVARGTELRLGRTVESVEKRSRGVRVLHGDGEFIDARCVVVCAGAWADRLAVSAGAPADPRIVPFRGAYLKLRPEARARIRGMIYPVPDPALPFLGVHLTRQISGDVVLGPTALLAARRAPATGLRSLASDLGSTVAWPGTWRMASRFWRAGASEVRLAASRRAFVAACARYVPGLTTSDVEPGFAGIRAQAIDRRGGLVDDFVFSEDERTLHVRNAPSPAATASLAIGSIVATRAAAMLAP